MTAEIGQYALILALMVSAVGGVLTLAGAELASRSWMRVGMAAAAVLAVLATIAIGALAWGFVESDFSILNVARNSNIALPWYYKLAAVWGSHEGSILFWVTTLAWWIFAVALSARHLPERVLARILGTLFIITFGLYLFILTTSNPFLRLFPPAEAGADLNPLLQDPGMIFHPPLLYLGYVGFAVPFAFAVAALLGGRLDVAWARWMRPWTTASWVLLTLGISLGSYWSYYELGWGGWWAWDPVENASLMPWLTGTALMHSLAVTEKRGAFKIWTVFLAILTFSLSLLGTFLVRSGVLTSVHAFASDPARGMFILIFLVIVIGVSFLLFAWRAGSVASAASFSGLSRESLLMGNNLLLVAGMAIVLLGTLYPLFLDAVGGGRITVGGPYFESVFGSAMVPLAFLVPVGAVCAWKSQSIDRMGRLLGLPLALALVLGLLTPVLLGAWSTVMALAAFLAYWIVFGAAADWVRYARTARAQKRSVFGQTLPWWGMHIAHLGLALLIFGAAANGIYQVERGAAMQPGQTVQVRDVTLRYDGWSEYRGPNYTAAKGVLTIVNDQGKEFEQLFPEKRNYDAVQNMTMTEAAILHRLTEDIYVSLASPTPDGEGWVVRAYVKPFVTLIWIGTLFMALGGLLAMATRSTRAPQLREMGKRAAVSAAGTAAACCVLAMLAAPASSYAAEPLMGSVTATEKSKAAAAFLDSAPSLGTVENSADAFANLKTAEAKPSEFDPAANPRVHNIASQLRCLVCANETIAESNAQLAVDLRREVAEQVKAGRTDDEVVAFMVERYGDYVLFKPPFKAKTWLLWLGPIAFVFLAFWGMVRIVRIRREDAKARRLAASAESLACAKAFLRGEVEYVDGGFAARQSSLKNGVQTRGASE